MTFPGGENEGNDWRDDDDGEPWEADQPVADEQLSLTGEDDALPWLSGDDYEDEDQGGGTDYRILVFGLLALALLGAILWGAKSFLDRRGDGASDRMADGSTISAPADDYKERPADPGGQDVAGTGDLAYEVGEGVTREGRVGAEPAPAASGVARPSVDLGQGPRPAPAASGTPRAAASGTARPAAATSGGVGVQVGAFQTRESAETGWQQLSGRYSALQGVNHRVVEGTVDSGTIYRLQAVAANAAAADALCRSIRNAGGDCQVKR